jgi:RNA polymerase sigma-70 factor, ECF subfamily
MAAPSTGCVTDLLTDLVARARRGDTEAFGDLVDLHRQAVYRAALAALRSPEDAEDVAQEAFVTAFQKLDGFRGEASFKTWVITIAWRKALDRRSSLARWMRRLAPGGRPEDDGRADPIDNLPAGDPSHEEVFLGAELASAVRQRIDALPSKLRDALLLVGAGEHSYEEAAAVLGIPVGTVKWRVSEARRRLKAALVESGYHHD